MVISARCDLIADLDVRVADAQGNPLIAEARAAFVQGPRNAVKLYSRNEISIVSMGEGKESYRIRIHLAPEDTAKFKAGPNATVDFQLYLLPQSYDGNGEAVPDAEPIASEVLSIPIKRSLVEAIIDLGGELVAD